MSGNSEAAMPESLISSSVAKSWASATARASSWIESSRHKATEVKPEIDFVTILRAMLALLAGV